MIRISASWKNILRDYLTTCSSGVWVGWYAMFGTGKLFWKIVLVFRGLKMRKHYDTLVRQFRLRKFFRYVCAFSNSFISEPSNYI